MFLIFLLTFFCGAKEQKGEESRPTVTQNQFYTVNIDRFLSCEHVTAPVANWL